MKFSTKLSVLSVLLFATSAQAQYCTLPGRTPYSALQPGIKNFTLNTINRSSDNVEDMSKVVVETGDTTTLVAGNTYTVSILHNRDSVFFPTSRNNVRVWIDYNNNKKFDDAGETTISADYVTYGTFVDSFTIPATATRGTFRLRATVKMSSDAGHIIPSPCDSPTIDPIGYHGEMEDYMVKIVSAPATAIRQIGAVQTIATIFPNPTTGQVGITFDEVSSEPVTISVYDITGKQAAVLLDRKLQSTTTYSFNLNDYSLSAGVYFVKVVTVSGNSYQKLIKTN
ncbi:MAG: T9SS type A sorting domain-containing protein [Taibaiella sp.]|nr:T9SS type A sorting domain-containing protein [Taibaiella sp.]